MADPIKEQKIDLLGRIEIVRNIDLLGRIEILRNSDDAEKEENRVGRKVSKVNLNRKCGDTYV